MNHPGDRALRALALTLLCGLTSLWITDARCAEPVRARDLGIPFSGEPGPWNAITDVPGVEVGHTTIIEGEGDLVIGKGPVRTGVTSILPRGKRFGPVFAAVASLNGNGEMTGTEWIHESGYLEEPILLTNTHSIGAVHEAAIRWRAARGFHPPDAGYGWAALPVVAETWDGRLNDIHGFHVTKAHVFSALDTATTGPVPEGNVGGGTGMVCYRFKGGIGTASRLVGDYRVGVLVQANYGQRDQLIIAGIPVGREINDLRPVTHSLDPVGTGHSILVIVATDAPLAPHQLGRLARRVPLGIARLGGIGANSSGDLFLAFSTSPTQSETDDPDGIVQSVQVLKNDAIDPFFRATIEATEEAIVNALVAAETMTGVNGNTVYAIPHRRLQKLMNHYNRSPDRD